MKKITRKGSGRKKGQLCKVFEAEQPLAELLSLAERGNYRKDVLRVYQHLRTISFRFDSTIRSCNRYEKSLHNTKRFIYAELASDLRENNSPEIFQTLWVLVNAVRKKDIAFFKDLARTFELMVNKDAAPLTIPAPPAAPDFFWLGRLRKTRRGAFTLDEIGDWLEKHTGQRPSLSSISAKAKKAGISVNPRFGKIR